MGAQPCGSCGPSPEQQATQRVGIAHPPPEGEAQEGTDGAQLPGKVGISQGCNWIAA